MILDQKRWWMEKNMLLVMYEVEVQSNKLSDQLVIWCITYRLWRTHCSFVQARQDSAALL